jgi:hypothetical protein
LASGSPARLVTVPCTSPVVRSTGISTAVLPASATCCVLVT